MVKVEWGVWEGLIREFWGSEMSMQGTAVVSLIGSEHLTFVLFFLFFFPLPFNDKYREGVNRLKNLP